MSYCPECGTQLIRRHLENEGEIPYCETCKASAFQPLIQRSALLYMHQAARNYC